MIRRTPKFTAKLNPLDQLKRELNIHIKVLDDLITDLRQWLENYPKDSIKDYIEEKSNQIQSDTGKRFSGIVRESVALTYYIDTIRKYADLPKEQWISENYRFHDTMREGYLEKFRNLLKQLLNYIEQDSIKSLIDQIGQIFFIKGSTTQEVIDNLFKTAEKWQDVLISLITIPMVVHDESKLPLLTNEAVQVLFSATNQFNSAYKKQRISDDYLVPIIFSEDLLGDWAGLRFQKRYEYILQLLGFITKGDIWYPTLNNLPSLEVNLISILEGLGLCEIKINPTTQKKAVTLTMDSYSLHLIYYLLILKNINHISEIATSWISYYFTRVIYSYFRMRLENEGNPFAHLMEEANFKNRVFKPLWQVVATYLPIPNNEAIYVESEWLQSAPKETDEHIKNVIEYITDY